MFRGQPLFSRFFPPIKRPFQIQPSFGIQNVPRRYNRREAKVVALMESASLVLENPEAARAVLQNAPVKFDLGEARSAPAIANMLVSLAVESQLFGVAAALTLKFSNKVALSQTVLHNTITGLLLYDSKYTPAYVKALDTMHRSGRIPLDLSSSEKATLLDTVLNYVQAHESQSLVFDTFRLVEKIPSGPIPVSSLWSLISYFLTRNAPGYLMEIWRYIQHHYPGSSTSYVPIVTRLMTEFAQKEQFRGLALEIARGCRPDCLSDLAVALAVANTCAACKDLKLADKLRKTLGDNIGRPVAGALMLLYADTNESEVLEHLTQIVADSGTGFTATETSKFVKYLARKDVLQAETFLESQKLRETEKLSAYMNLCNQAIHNKDRDLFDKYLVRLPRAAKFPVHGQVLNLQIKWQYLSGDFDAAKLIYQKASLRGRIDPRQRQVALNTLADFICRIGHPQAAVDWLYAEYECLGLPQKLATTRLNRQAGQA